MRKEVSMVIALLVVLICAGAGVYLLMGGSSSSQADMQDNPKKVEYVHGSYAVNPENTEELVGFHDNVFVGKVVKWLGNKQPKEGEFSIPYNEYEVEVLDNLKGELKDKVVIQKMGGYNEKNVLVLMGEEDKKDRLPELGKSYIFIAGIDEEGKLIIDGSYSQIEVKEKMADSRTKKEIQKYKKAVRNQIPYKREQSASKNVKVRE